MIRCTLSLSLDWTQVDESLPLSEQARRFIASDTHAGPVEVLFALRDDATAADVGRLFARVVSQARVPLPPSEVRR